MILDRERMYRVEEIFDLVRSATHDHLSSRDAQQLYEARVVASLIQTVRSFENRDNCVDPNIRLMQYYEQAPDVRVISLDNRGFIESSHDVEVVSFTPYSEEEGLLKFFKRTKLSPVYAYPEGTVIVCHVGIPIKKPKDMGKRISNVLTESGPFKYQLYLLCDNTQNSSAYIARIYPEFEEY